MGLRRFFSDGVAAVTSGLGLGRGMALQAAIAGEPQSVSVDAWEAAYRRRKHALCAISFRVPGGLKLGTGILIGPDLVLTNYHVVQDCHDGPASDLAKGLRCRFDYFNNRDAGDRNARMVPLAWPDWLVAHSLVSPLDREGADLGRNKDHLDYAIIRLREAIGHEALGEVDTSEPRGWQALPVAPRLPERNETITLMHHPARTEGQPPQLALRLSESKVLDLVDGDLRVRHGAWSAPGSSGGPCFGRNHVLVALHQGGDTPRDGAPARWNQSIPIVEIVRHVQATCKERIVGFDPPALDEDPPPTPRTHFDRPTIARDVVTVRVEAAKILLDRNPVEGDIIRFKARQGIVHVITCRQADRHVWLLDRLCKLSLRLKAVGLEVFDERKTLLTAMLTATSAEVPGAWTKVPIEAPSRNDNDATRIDRLIEAIGQPPTGKQFLVEIVTTIDDCSFAREKALVTGFAAHCKDRHSPANLQVMFIYHDGRSTTDDDRWRDKRKQFATMWGAGAAPAGCGACVALDDVGSTDLTTWSTDLKAAWNVNETRLRDRILADLPDTVKKTMVEVERCLEPVIRQCLSDTL